MDHCVVMKTFWLGGIFELVYTVLPYLSAILHNEVQTTSEATNISQKALLYQS